MLGWVARTVLGVMECCELAGTVLGVMESWESFHFTVTGHRRQTLVSRRPILCTATHWDHLREFVVQNTTATTTGGPVPKPRAQRPRLGTRTPQRLASRLGER